jgi:hypothetical protein
VGDGVEGDVHDVLVGDGVGDLAAAAAAGEHVGVLEDLEVLGNERLAGAEGRDEVVDAAFAVADLEDDGEAEGVGEGLQEFGRRIQI